MNKILIIDDNKDFLNDLSIMLSKNFKVHQAETSWQALRLLKKHKPGLCLIDVRLPAYCSNSSMTEGIALAEKIVEKNQHQKIIFISRYDFPSIKTTIHSYSFIKKPFKIYILQEMLQHLLINPN